MLVKNNSKFNFIFLVNLLDCIYQTSKLMLILNLTNSFEGFKMHRTHYYEYLTAFKARACLKKAGLLYNIKPTQDGWRLVREWRYNDAV